MSTSLKSISQPNNGGDMLPRYHNRTDTNINTKKHGVSTKEGTGRARSASISSAAAATLSSDGSCVRCLHSACLVLLLILLLTVALHVSLIISWYTLLKAPETQALFSTAKDDGGAGLSNATPCLMEVSTEPIAGGHNCTQASTYCPADYSCPPPTTGGAGQTNGANHGGHGTGHNSSPLYCASKEAVCGNHHACAAILEGTTAYSLSPSLTPSLPKFVVIASLTLEGMGFLVGTITVCVMVKAWFLRRGPTGSGGDCMSLPVLVAVPPLCLALAGTLILLTAQPSLVAGHDIAAAECFDTSTNEFYDNLATYQDLLAASLVAVAVVVACQLASASALCCLSDIARWFTGDARVGASPDGSGPPGASPATERTTGAANLRNNFAVVPPAAWGHSESGYDTATPPHGGLHPAYFPYAAYEVAASDGQQRKDGSQAVGAAGLDTMVQMNFLGVGPPAGCFAAPPPPQGYAVDCGYPVHDAYYASGNNYSSYAMEGGREGSVCAGEDGGCVPGYYMPSYEESYFVDESVGSISNNGSSSSASGSSGEEGDSNKPSRGPPVAPSGRRAPVLGLSNLHPRSISGLGSLVAAGGSSGACGEGGVVGEGSPVSARAVAAAGSALSAAKRTSSVVRSRSGKSNSGAYTRSSRTSSNNSNNSNNSTNPHSTHSTTAPLGDDGDVHNRRYSDSSSDTTGLAGSVHYSPQLMRSPLHTPVGGGGSGSGWYSPPPRYVRQQQQAVLRNREMAAAAAGSAAHLNYSQQLQHLQYIQRLQQLHASNLAAAVHGQCSSPRRRKSAAARRASGGPGDHIPTREREDESATASATGSAAASAASARSQRYNSTGATASAAATHAHAHTHRTHDGGECSGAESSSSCSCYAYRVFDSPVSPHRNSATDRGVDFSWRKGSRLGKGGFGTVYLAQVEDSAQLIAVKEVVVKTRDERNVDRFQRELAILSQCAHPNVVQFIGSQRRESATEPGLTSLYILMEYVPGGSLSQLIQDMNGLSESAARFYVYQLLRGLAYMHSHSIAHQDIKAANVLLCVFEGQQVCKIADFGCSRLLSGLESVNSVTGTPNFMAPEVIRQTGAGRPCDIWSLGCTVIEMLTGQPPFPDLEPMQILFAIGTGKTPPLPESISAECADFLSSCFTVDSKERPTADELLQHPWLAGAHAHSASCSLSESAASVDVSCATSTAADYSVATESASDAAPYRRM